MKMLLLVTASTLKAMFGTGYRHDVVICFKLPSTSRERKIERVRERRQRPEKRERNREGKQEKKRETNHVDHGNEKA